MELNLDCKNFIIVLQYNSEMDKFLYAHKLCASQSFCVNVGRLLYFRCSQYNVRYHQFYGFGGGGGCLGAEVPIVLHIKFFFINYLDFRYHVEQT